MEQDLREESNITVLRCACGSMPSCDFELIGGKMHYRLSCGRSRCTFVTEPTRVLVEAYLLWNESRAGSVLAQ